MTDRVRINREQLARICKDDNQAIRAFEALIRRVNDQQEIIEAQQADIDIIKGVLGL